MTPFIPYGEPSAHENSMGCKPPTQPKVPNYGDFIPFSEASLEKLSGNRFNVDDKPKRRGAKVMNEAAGIINGERNEHYGEPEDNFRNIAEMWNAYLRPRYGFDKLDAYDVAMLMVLMKVARNGHHRKLDNLVDLVGYAAHAGDIGDQER